MKEDTIIMQPDDAIEAQSPVCTCRSKLMVKIIVTSQETEETYKGSEREDTENGRKKIKIKALQSHLIQVHIFLIKTEY